MNKTDPQEQVLKYIMNLDISKNHLIMKERIKKSSQLYNDELYKRAGLETYMVY